MAAFKGNDLIASFESVFKGLPDLPVNIRDVLVQIVPWLALIFGIMGVLGGLGAIGLTPVATLGGVGVGTNVLLSGVIAVVASGLLLFAFPKLRRHQHEGWRLLFWSQIVSFLSSVVTLTVSSIIGGLIGAAIGFYLLFQIKSHYK